jgi:hypothetical protein
MAMPIGIGVLMILNGRRDKPRTRSAENSLVESRSPTQIHKPGLIWTALSMPLFERWMNKLRRFVGTVPLKFLIAFQKSIKGEKLETLLNELGFLGMKLIDWWIAFTMSQYYRRY